MTGTPLTVVVHDRSSRAAKLLPLTLGTARLRDEKRRVDALLRQVVLDGEDHRRFEPRGRQDAAVVTRVEEPLDDRPQALRHTRGWIGDAVIVDQEKSHDPFIDRASARHHTSVSHPRRSSSHVEVRQHDLQEKTQQLLQGPLKHVRAAALAAALLPLASVVATPAAAQSCLPSSGGFCGVVFNDANNNGTRDAAETGIEGVKIVATDTTSPLDTFRNRNRSWGAYILPVGGGTYTIGAFIPTGAQPSTANIGSDLFDSDARPHRPVASSVTDITIDFSGGVVDFGFYTAPVAQPRHGTPGFWKNSS